MDPVPPGDDTVSRLPSPSPGPSFGEELRRERELRGIPLREIAEATKINLRFLEALERNEFATLPGGLFTRGFIRAYANHIGADADRLVNAYLYHVSQEQERAARETTLRAAGPKLETRDGERISARPQRRWGWIAAFVVAVVAVGVAGALALRPDWRARLQGPWPAAWLAKPAPAAEPRREPAAPPLPPVAEERRLEIAAGDLVRVYATCGGVLLLDRTLNPGERAEVRCAASLRVDATSGGDIRLYLDGVDLGIPGERGLPLQGWEPPPPAPPA